MFLEQYFQLLNWHINAQNRNQILFFPIFIKNKLYQLTPGILGSYPGLWTVQLIKETLVIFPKDCWSLLCSKGKECQVFFGFPLLQYQ